MLPFMPRVPFSSKGVEAAYCTSLVCIPGAPEVLTELTSALKMKTPPGTVAHAFEHSDSGGKGRRITSTWPVWAT